MGVAKLIWALPTSAETKMEHSYTHGKSVEFWEAPSWEFLKLEVSLKPEGGTETIDLILKKVTKLVRTAVPP